MTIDKGIYIKNIYYMLCYAFKTLKNNNYEKVKTENFDHIENFFATLIDISFSKLLKEGLYKEYIEETDSLKVLKGKIELNDTIKKRIRFDNSLVCNFDELSINNYFNRIIKTTISYLSTLKNVSKENKANLKKKKLFLQEVDVISNIKNIRWDSLKFNSNNERYRLIINICYFVLNGLIQTTESGNKKIIHFSEEKMERLFEKFVLEYYKQEHKELIVNASQIEWNIDSEKSQFIDFLPKMQTDITLRSKESNKILIIDAKYYGSIMSNYDRFNSRTYHSANLYQIFTYVKNADVSNKGNVSGTLLYAKTIEENIPVGNASIGGNIIGVNVLDLNHDFSEIRKQLDDLATSLL